MKLFLLLIIFSSLNEVIAQHKVVINSTEHHSIYPVYFDNSHTISTNHVIVKFKSNSIKEIGPSEVFPKETLFNEGFLLNDKSAALSFINYLDANYNVSSFYRHFKEGSRSDTLRYSRKFNSPVRLIDNTLVIVFEISKSISYDDIEALNLKFTGTIDWIQGPTLTQPASEPNDPELSTQWAVSYMDFIPAWEISNSTSNVRIAISDWFRTTGSVRHNDLQIVGNGGNVLEVSASKVFMSSLNYRTDDDHGIEVASVAGSTFNNNTGLAIYSKNALILPVPQNETGIASAVFNDADIINCSWISGDTPALSQAIYNAIASGVVVIAASGNSTTQPFVFYPAAYHFTNLGQVIAVTASQLIPNPTTFPQYERRRPEFNYSPGIDPFNDPIRSFIDITAPGNGIRIVAWDNPSGYTTTNGTSFAAPIVSSVASLVLSVRPNTTPQDMYEILTLSTDDIILEYEADNPVNFVNHPDGIRKWNRFSGYGRLNALKAVYRAQRMRVEEEMASYKSLDESATATNQGRRIVHDGSSSHIVFESGGEIVYFKRLSNGSLSTPILLSQLQDTLIGRNGKPSITLSGSTVHVVWQKKRYGHDVYDIVHRYSTNGGSSWSSEVYANESLAQTWDPIPALAGSMVSWSPQMMLTYRGPDGIHALVYNFSTNLFSPYATGNSLMLADTLATSPALAASYYGSNNKQHIAWSDNGASIRYSMFTASSGTWSTPVNLSSIVSGSASHLTPSISGNINGNIHLVWHRSTGSGQYQNIIYHRRKHSSDGTWPNQYSATYYQYQGTPSIKSVNSSEAMLAWSQLVPSTHCTYKQPYNSNGQWGNVTQLSCGGARYPSISLYGENRAVWTSGTVLPSDIVVSSSTLKDQAQEDPLQIRSLSWRPSPTSSHIELRLAPPLLIVNGMQIVLPWAPVHPDTNITLSNLSDILKPDLSSVDNGLLEAGNIRFRLQIMAEESKDLNGIDLNFIGLDRIIHTQLVEADFGKTDANYTIDIPARSISSNTSVHIRPTIQPGSELALGSLFLDADGWQRLNGSASEAIQFNESREAPTMYSISAYPNPFNPTTQILFSIPESGSVQLTVHDILGREVAILVNGILPAGEHQATFDATNLSSGIYLYRLQAGNQILTGKLMLVR